jgi:hypothetical protein
VSVAIQRLHQRVKNSLQQPVEPVLATLGFSKKGRKCHFFKSGAEIFVILLILGAMGLSDDAVVKSNICADPQWPGRIKT